MSLLPALRCIHGLPDGPYGFFIGDTPRSLYPCGFFRQNEHAAKGSAGASAGTENRRIPDKLRPKSSPFANSFMQNNL